jgi:hypothetical protein
MGTNINFNKVLGISKGCNIILASTPPPALLLDTYPNAAVAYSLRQLRTAYTGAAIRVRRSSDNAEQDFGFSGNDLDTASLLTFCGAGNGFITTWYDQSVNGNNATQVAASIQPRIVNSGSLVTENGKVAINDYVGTLNYHLTLTTQVAGTDIYSFNVIRYNGTNNCLFGGQVNSTYVLIGQAGGTTPFSSVVATYRQNGSPITYATRDEIATNLVNQTLVTIDMNNSSWTQFKIGYRISGSSMYKVQEIVIFNSDQSVNQVGIETNINSYYNIYP